MSGYSPGVITFTLIPLMYNFSSIKCIKNEKNVSKLIYVSILLMLITDGIAPARHLTLSEIKTKVFFLRRRRGPPRLLCPTSKPIALLKNEPIILSVPTTRNVQYNQTAPMNLPRSAATVHAVWLILLFDFNSLISINISMTYCCSLCRFKDMRFFCNFKAPSHCS